MTRYVLDTNLFVDAIRSESAAGELERFYQVFLPFTWLSAVVVQELLAGTRRGAEDDLERDLVEPFEKRGRVLVPSFAAHKRAGRALAALGTDPARGLPNDALLAASCRETGMALVTRNARDFSRLRARMPGFTFVPPWPMVDCD